MPALSLNLAETVLVASPADKLHTAEAELALVTQVVPLLLKAICVTPPESIAVKARVTVTELV